MALRKSSVTVVAAALAMILVTVPADARAERQSSYRRIDVAGEAYLYYSLGRLMEVQGLLEDALVQFRRAESLDPGHCEIEVAIGRVLLATGESDGAREKTRQALAQCPDDAQAAAVYATASILLGEPDEAVRALDERARRPDAPEELVVLLAQALQAEGRTGEAGELYARRAAADSLSGRIAYLRAQALLAEDRLDEAVAELSRAERLDPENRAVEAALGRLLVADGRTEEGVEVLERLLDRGPGLEAEYVALARGYSDLARSDRAIEAVVTGIEAIGETPGLLSALGSLRFQAGDVEGALRAYERVLEISPDSVQALNFIAYTLADEDIDPSRALPYAERAVELDPENGFVRDTLGWTYFKLKRFDDARETLEDAIRLGGAESIVYEHLGDALQAVGLVHEAISAWSRALELEPGRESSIERIEAAREGLGDGGGP